MATNGTAIVPTPIFHDDKVFITSDYGAGCALVSLTETGGKITAKLEFENKVMENHHGGVVLLDGHLYGCTGGRGGGGWICQNFKTGERAWRSTDFRQGGAVTVADGMLYCYGQNDGTVVLVEPNSTAWKEKGRLKIPEESKLPRGSGLIWTHPVVANGKLFLRDLDLIFCYDVKEK